ncbi:hypothetical protein RVR_1047 [Actinacidiphila reveromycinica]|uniref:Uncharacterized protein n=1 Tax=Actinacidiphila reveromycinica TaxID=659352 RepID=A0A7U3VLW0_9ACTN|nr:DUF5995 family protein [Streptomyces sp. SN-593]BBA95959.1 hypothetical protein RVR_1047 [Streptomyces sp. SN-593]
MTTTAQWSAPGDVADVVGRMRALAVRLPPADGVAVFNRVYLAVTEEFARRLGRGRFSDGPEAAELAVLFAGRYLAAVEGAGGPEAEAGTGAGTGVGTGSGSGAGTGVGTGTETWAGTGDVTGGAADGSGGAPACWRPLLRARADPDVRPLQFALAGITAHVGHDLALAVVDTCRATGRSPAAVAPDYAEVGAVLTAIEVRVREELMPGPDLLERFDPLTHAVASWSLARARDGAWATARLLWALRDRGEAYADCAHGLDASVGAMACALLAPFPVGADRLARRPALGVSHPDPAARAAQAAPPLPVLPILPILPVPGSQWSQSSGSSTGAISS